MSGIKLQIGKTYHNRDRSETIKIVRRADPTDVFYRKSHPFVDSEGYAYKANGRVHNDKEYPFDLIQEVQQGKSPCSSKTKSIQPKSSSGKVSSSTAKGKPCSSPSPSKSGPRIKRGTDKKKSPS